jgi:hypothetical protein
MVRVRGLTPPSVGPRIRAASRQADGISTRPDPRSREDAGIDFRRPRPSCAAMIRTILHATAEANHAAIGRNPPNRLASTNPQGPLVPQPWSHRAEWLQPGRQAPESPSSRKLPALHPGQSRKLMRPRREQAPSPLCAPYHAGALVPGLAGREGSSPPSLHAHAGAIRPVDVAS